MQRQRRPQPVLHRTLYSAKCFFIIRKSPRLDKQPYHQSNKERLRGNLQTRNEGRTIPENKSNCPERHGLGEREQHVAPEGCPSILSEWPFQASAVDIEAILFTSQ